MLPETDQHRAFLFAEELLEQIRKSLRPAQIELTASVGVASSPEHATDLAGLMRGRRPGAVRGQGSRTRSRRDLQPRGHQRARRRSAGRRNVENQAHLATVLSLAEALDQRDSGTARHSQTVGRLCEMMARELGLDDDRVQRIRLAGILHDIGKIGVPDSILCKPGPLTSDEWVQMRRHPELGRPDPLQPRAGRRPRVDPRPPRAPGRHRLPEGPNRRADPPRGLDRRRRRRLRGDDQRPRLPAGDRPGSRARGASATTPARSSTSASCDALLRAARPRGRAGHADAARLGLRRPVRAPPAAGAHQAHRPSRPSTAGSRKAPDQGRVDEHGHRGADRHLLDVDQLGEGEGPHRDREQQRGGGDLAARCAPARGRSRPLVFASRAAPPRSAAAGTPRSRSRVRRRRRTAGSASRCRAPLAGVVESVLKPAVLEDEHQHPEGDADRERVHHQGDKRQHRATGSSRTAGSGRSRRR